MLGTKSSDLIQVGKITTALKLSQVAVPLDGIVCSRTPVMILLKAKWPAFLFRQSNWPLTCISKRLMHYAETTGALMFTMPPAYAHDIVKHAYAERNGSRSFCRRVHVSSPGIMKNNASTRVFICIAPAEGGWVWFIRAHYSVEAAAQNGENSRLGAKEEYMVYQYHSALVGAHIPPCSCWTDNFMVRWFDTESQSL